jgi:hypothetical protein
MRTRFCLENPRGRDHSENLNVDGRILLKWVLWKVIMSVNWIYIAQDRDQCWGLRGPKRR